MKPPKINEATPQDFFIPGIDQGLALVRSESLDPVQVPQVLVDGLALASDVEQRLRLVREMADIEERRVWSCGISFPTVLAIAEDVCFQNRHLSVAGKYLLSSAGGTRLRNRYAKLGPEIDGMAPDTALVEHMGTQSFNNRRGIPVATDIPRDLPFVIDARNYFNFYHFTKETLPLLTLVDEYELTGPILIVTGSSAKPVGFVSSYVETWFPHLVERVQFLHAPQTMERAFIALDTRHVYYQCRENVMQSIEGVSAEPVGRRATFDNMSIAACNSFEAPVADLRRHVLARIDGSPARRRIYVRRRSTRERHVVGEDLLERRLQRLGFQTIFFEDLSLKAQATTVSESECIVSLHGAGLANMLFAPAGCHVVELSNLQTLLKRFGDFNPLALAAGVHYLHIYLDHDFEDRKALPSIAADGHRGVSIGGFEVDVIGAKLASLLDPEAQMRATEICRSLNDERRHDGLKQALDAHSDLLFHVPDWHVWQANVAADRGDRPAVLAHLHHAMILAPLRLPLLKRIMGVAQELGNQDVFLEATACFMQHSPQKADKFLRQNNWTM